MYTLKDKSHLHEIIKKRKPERNQNVAYLENKLKLLLKQARKSMK